MPSWIQSALIGGEWAPDYDGRTDLDGYRHALALCRNFLVMPGGGATRRPGTGWAANGLSNDPAAGKVRLKSFGPNNQTQYTIEFSPGAIRFFRNKALVALAPLVSPYLVGELAGLSFTKTQPPQTDIDLWLWHPAHPPQQLKWGGTDTSWSLVQPAFQDGPYLDAIGGTTTATPGAAAASAPITLSNTTEVNNGQGFLASDVGRCVRFLCPTWTLSQLVSLGAAGATYHVGDTINPAGGTALATPIPGTVRQAVLTVTAVDATTGAVKGGTITDGGQYIVPPAAAFTQGGTSGLGSGLTGTVGYTQTGTPVWIWGTITAVADAMHATVSIGLLWIDAIGAELRSQLGQFLSTAPITTWRLGAWCPFLGFPACAGIFQGRLVVGGQAAAPRRVWGSETGSFVSFAPSLSNNGQVVASNAYSFDLDDEQADPIVWISPAGSAQIPQLAIGKGNAEHIIQPANSGAALSPTNIQTYRETTFGTAPVAPLRIGRLLLFLERGGKKLRQWMYQWSAGGFLGPDAAPYIRHLLLGAWQDMAYAQIPWPTIWAIDSNGFLSGLTFQFDEKEAANNLAAGHSHQLGGSYYGNLPIVESLSVQPSEDQSYDQLWLSVLRNDTGAVTRTIEVLTPVFRGQPLDQAVFVDLAVSSALTFPNATCTPAAGPFLPSNGLLPVRGDTASFSFSGNVALAADLSPGTVLRINGGTFLLRSVTDAQHVTCQCMDPVFTLQPAPATGWSYTKMKTSFTGFGVHTGRVVQVLADGADEGTQLVAGGTIVLAEPASYVTAGPAIPYQIDTLDLDLPAADGTSQMKTGRLDHIWLRVFQSGGFRYGPSPDSEHPNPTYDTIEARADTDLLNWPPALVSDDLRLAFPGGSSAHRRVTVKGQGPFPLTVLALVVKGGTTEMAPK